MTVLAPERFSDSFDGDAATALGAGVPWLAERRDQAMDTLRVRGIPHRRIEDWKYSDLKSALEKDRSDAAQPMGWRVSALPNGVELFDLARLADAPDWVRAHFGRSAADAAMPAASFALVQSGFGLRVGKGVHVGEAVELDFSGKGHGRALLVLEDGATLTVLERVSAGDGFSNIGIELVLGRNAHFTHVRLAEAAPLAVQVSDVAIRIARDASYRAHLFSGGASLSRLTLRMTLKEPGASAELSGVTVLGGMLHSDLTTEVYHASGETRSTQLFKNAVGGMGRAIYQGKVTVAEGANGSDSRQTAKALLLSERAEADLKPELEILADDVKCAHGAAVGDLDPEMVFYLRSRGIPEGDARDMLVHAFLEEAVAMVPEGDLSALLRQAAEDALQRAMGVAA